MKSLEFIYQDTQIHFLLQKEGEVMVNATEMAKAFDKQARSFLRLETTQNFITALLKRENNRTDVYDYMEEKDVVFSNKKGGTYMHRKLALKFAAWLDVEFELWVFDTIEEITNGYFRKYKIAMEQEVRAKFDKELATIRLKESPNEETMRRFFEADERIKAAKSDKRKASNGQYSFLEQLYEKELNGPARST